MQIKIRKGNAAVLISFDTCSSAFDSNYERNKFFSELHGRKQIIIKRGRRYEYRREGLLDTIPNMRVDNSVFIIMQEHMKMIEKFFMEWEDKVIFKTFPVILSRREIHGMERAKREIEVK